MKLVALRLVSGRVTPLLIGLVSLVAANAAYCQSGQPLDPPVVYVHYDYMAGYDATIGAYVSFAPPPEAIQTVVDSFRKHGVILHIDPQHNVIPYHEVVIPDWDPRWQNASTSCTGNDAVSFMALRAQYFQPHDNRPWHYAIFVHNAGLPDTAADGNACPADPVCLSHPDPNGSGVSEVPGLNFMVAFGYITDIGNPIDSLMWAGTFMHELGHNLGLRHGGVYAPPQSCLAFKPNYVSVMAYMYQSGIPYSTNGDPTVATGARIDYSDETLLTLNETDLDETAGVGSVLHPNDIIQYCSGFLGCTARAFASGPIDWDLDGTATGLHASADIDNDNGIPNAVLWGFNDWAYVGQFIRIRAYRSGQVHGTTAIQ